jgi:COP9 signalosome complex subunit 7
MASSSTAKLEPFLLMAKSAKGVATTKLIENATAAPGVYVYAELLDAPNVKDVRGG